MNFRIRIPVMHSSTYLTRESVCFLAFRCSTCSLPMKLLVTGEINRMTHIPAIPATPSRLITRARLTKN